MFIKEAYPQLICIHIQLRNSVQQKFREKLTGLSGRIPPGLKWFEQAEGRSPAQAPS
jgi:hypothetical protein